MITEVYLAPYGSDSFIQIDISKDMPMPISKSIIDLTSIDGGGPGQLMSSASKTITLPGTKTNNEILGHIFEINIDGTFDTRKRAYCRIYIDKLMIWDGVLRLETVNELKGRINYEVQITEGVRSFYNSMMVNDAILGSYRDALLTDLYTASDAAATNPQAFGALDHVYDYTTESASWTATSGSTYDSGNGYVYPMIDYGLNDLHAWYINQFFPAVYVKEYLDRIFEFCGYSYTSSFFGTAFFKGLIIPYCNGAWTLSNTEYIARYFHASRQGGTQSITTGLVKVAFDSESGTGDVDPSSEYDYTTNHRWTVPAGKGGFYDVVTVLNVSSISGTVIAYIYINGTAVLPGTLITTSPTTLSITNRHFNAGDYVEIFIQSVSGGSVDVLNGSVFYNNPLGGLQDGDTMTMLQAIPQNIKIKDFFESICKMFNLQVELDINDKKKLIIEPWTDFYNGDVQDWTDKWDTSQETVITPMGLLNHKNYLLSYASDSDYWNDYYTNRHYTLDHDDIYGEMQITTDNDYLTDNYKMEIIFAPTPLVLYNTGIFAPGGVPNTKVLSTIHMGSSNGNDPVNIWPTPPSANTIRILQYGGLVDGAWEHWDSGSSSWVANTTYPYAGHIDNLLNPKDDINFGLTAELFFSFTGQIITNGTLYGKRYDQFIKEITDKDSKVVELYCRLTAADLFLFSFRNVIRIDKTYYKVLEIVDFDLSTPKTTKLKLLKSTTPPPLTFTQYSIGGGGEAGVEKLPIPYNPPPVPMLNKDSVRNFGGVGNAISDTASTVIIHASDNNTVSGGSSNITIIGGSGNNVIGSNVTLVNCTSQNITENDVVYVNNKKYLSATTPGNTALVAGTKVVAYTGVTAASIIMITWDGTGVLAGNLSVTPGTDSFTINSTNAGDTAGVNWYIAKL